MVEGVGVDEGVSVGDVLLAASGLPFAVFLGGWLKPNLVKKRWDFGLTPSAQ